MSLLLIGLASVVVSLLLLFGLEKLISRGGKKSDIAAELRDLLIAKAEGRIDQAEFERQQALLHATVLKSDSGSATRDWTVVLRWAVPALLIVLVAGGLYWGAPTPSGVPASGNDEMAKLPEVKQNAQAGSGGDLNTVAKKLADKMAKDPNNGEGWLLLAKTYTELRRHAEADAAYEKASALVTLDASALADWADARVMTKDRKWDDEARKIVKRAVAADPKHVKALALAGSEAFDRADYKAAIDFWKRMKAAAAPDSMDVKLADANIAEANSMLSGKKPAASAVPAAQIDAVAGTVTLSSKLKGKVGAEDTVFVTAKAPDGSGPPLAVGRFKGKDFPIEFRLDDSAAIMPGRTISQFSEVLVTAKVSKSGTADASKGDILAAPVKAKLGATNLVVELNAER